MAANEVTTINGGLFTVVDETKNGESGGTHMEEEEGEMRVRRASFHLGNDDEVQIPISEESGLEQKIPSVSSMESGQIESSSVGQNENFVDRKLSEPVMGSAKMDMGDSKKLSFPDVIARRSAFTEKRKKMAKGKLGRSDKQKKKKLGKAGPREKVPNLSVYHELCEQHSLEDKGTSEKRVEEWNQRKNCIPEINIEKCHSSNEGDVFKGVIPDTTGHLPAIPNSTEFSSAKTRSEGKSASPRPKLPRLQIPTCSAESATGVIRSSRPTSRNSKMSEYESCGTPTDSLDQELYFSATSLNNTSPDMLSCSSKSPISCKGSKRLLEDLRGGTELTVGQNLELSVSPVLSRKQSRCSGPPGLKSCCSEKQLSCSHHEPLHKTSLPNLSASNSLMKLNRIPLPSPSGSQNSKKLLGSTSLAPTSRFSVASKDEHLEIGENDCHSKFGALLSVFCLLFFISYLIIIYNHFASMERVHVRFKQYALEREQHFQEFVVQIDIS